MRSLATALVRLFPAEFRARYGPDVAEMAIERTRAAHRDSGVFAALRVGFGQCLDILRAARAEHREGSAPRRVRPVRSGSGPAMADPGRGDGPLSTMVGECGRAWRSVRRAPQFAIVAAVTLALGIGATTAIFSVVYGVLLAPLPYPQADELVTVWLEGDAFQTSRINHPTSTYLTARDHNQTFAAIGAWVPGEATITGEGEPERVPSVGVTDGALRALGATPFLGRMYSAADTAPGAPPRAILMHGYWQRRFGADESIVGRTITVDGSQVEVIGVTEADFRFLNRDPALFWPIRLDAEAMPTVVSFDYRVIGRLAPGVSLERADADITRLLPASIERYAWVPMERLEEWGMTGNVRPLKEAVVGDVGPLLWVLFGAVSIVLIIACANVANLYLVRAEGRRAEIAVRNALGASRGTLARQFTVESLLVGFAGGVLGMAMAYAGVPVLLRLAPQGLPRVSGVALDPVTLLFCVAVSAIAGMIFGLAPLSYYGAPDLVPALKDGGRSASGSRGGARVRTVLAVAEVALALMLLVGAGLMIRSFNALAGVDTGVAAPERVLTMRLALTRGDYPDESQVLATYEQLLDRLASVPGVASAGAASGLPAERRSNQNSFLAESSPGEVVSGAYKAVAGDYFDAAGLPLLAGRTITWEDVRNRRPVGVVNESVATRFWGGAQQAIGQRIRHADNDPWREVIGVVGSVRDAGLRRDPVAVAYWPVVVDDFLGFDSWLRRDLAFVVRAEGDASSLVPQVREAVWSVDADLPIADLATLDDVLHGDLAVPRFTLVMLLTAAGVAVLLGTVGVYGVLSYAFAQRSQEIGIRMAIGADGGAVRALVMRQGALVAILGVGAGLAGAVAMSRFLATLVYGVGTHDLVSYGAAALLTGLVALAASVTPAVRAARIDPVQVMRR